MKKFLLGGGGHSIESVEYETLVVVGTKGKISIRVKRCFEMMKIQEYDWKAYRHNSKFSGTTDGRKS